MGMLLNKYVYWNRSWYKAVCLWSPLMKKSEHSDRVKFLDVDYKTDNADYSYVWLRVYWLILKVGSFCIMVASVFDQEFVRFVTLFEIPEMLQVNYQWLPG